MRTVPAADPVGRRPAAAPRGGRRRRGSPYLVVGTLFLAVMTAASWGLPVCCDFGLHAAVVERLKADLLHPGHPMIDLPGDRSPYYSPYTVVEGLVAWLGGLPGRYVVRAAAPVNLLVLLTGIGRFTRLLSPRPWATVFALGAMVLLWGVKPLWWSGYLQLTSLATTVSYPSTFAIGLTFHLWALTGSAALGGARTRRHAGAGLLLALVLLVHPITSVAAVVGVLCLVAGWQRHWSRAVARRWALTGATAVAAAASWPYFDVFSLVGDALVDHVHKVLYADMAARYGLALLGLPALWARWRRDHRDPLVLMFAALWAVVGYGWISGHYTYGRVIGLALVPAQFALAVRVAEGVGGGLRRRMPVVLAVTGACAGFLSAQAGAVVPRSVDPGGLVQPPRWSSYEWVDRHLAPGDIVLADGYRAVRTLPAYGALLVAPPWPDPLLSDRERNRRWQEVHAYFAPGTTASERMEIVRHHQARWVLLSRHQRLPPEVVAVAHSRGTGEVLARVPGPPGEGTGHALREAPAQPSPVSTHLASWWS
jgi:hypothetical protein